MAKWGLLVLVLLSTILLVPPVDILKQLAPWGQSAWGSTTPDLEGTNVPSLNDPAYWYALAGHFGVTESTLDIQVNVNREINGMFARAGCSEFAEVCWRATIVMFSPTEVHPHQATLLFLHELVHYFQSREAYWQSVWTYDIVVQEWDADARGLDMGCSLGLLPGHWALFWEYLRTQYGYTGDSGHGTTADRYSWGVRHAPACWPLLETP